jgi:hypothetical protein
MEDTKTILLPCHEKKKKEKPKRKISTRWKQEILECSTNQILEGLSKIANDITDEIITTNDNKNSVTNIMKELYKQCSYKRSGYLQQDRHKKMDGSLVLSVKDIAVKLIDSQLHCHYCRETTTVFYENVRDPQQWTLDRLDNSIGHSRDNVVICCLSCNLRRKTMNEERYLFTKQLNITKQDV